MVMKALRMAFVRGNPGKVPVVQAFWDAEARVYVASSEDIPGLATEAETLDRLVEKLKVMIPEVLDANGYADGDEIPFVLSGAFEAPGLSRAA